MHPKKYVMNQLKLYKNTIFPNEEEEKKYQEKTARRIIRKILDASKAIGF